MGSFYLSNLYATKPVRPSNSQSSSRNNSTYYEMVLPTYYRPLSTGHRGSQSEKGERYYNYSEFLSNYHSQMEGLILNPDSDTTRFLCKSARISYDRNECKSNNCLIYEFFISDTKTFLVPEGHPAPICVPSPVNKRLKNAIDYEQMKKDEEAKKKKLEEKK